MSCQICESVAEKLKNLEEEKELLIQNVVSLKDDMIYAHVRRHRAIKNDIKKVKAYIRLNEAKIAQLKEMEAKPHEIDS